MMHIWRYILIGLIGFLFLAVFAWFTAKAQIAFEQAIGAATPLNQNLLTRDRKVSAVATSVTYNYDIGSNSQVMAIDMVCSAGTASVTVNASSDNQNYLTIDTLAAASTIIKNYNNSTVGAGIALSPLAFRFIQLIIGSCAAGTSTLTFAVK